MKRLLIVFFTLFSLLSAKGAAFFDTTPTSRTFVLGAHMGFNMSNNTLGSTLFNTGWNSTSWGSGFEVGAIADLAFRDWLAIQPGFFYQSRSSNFSVVYDDRKNIQLGHNLRYEFQIPVLCSVRFNVTEKIRWIVEMGPYIAFIVGHEDSGMHIAMPLSEDNIDFNAHRNSLDGGVKIGSGLLVNDHYWVGLHYQAGFSNIYTSSTPLSGHAKTWSFTLGYNF